jgi:hypothetical protein
LRQALRHHIVRCFACFVREKLLRFEVV